MTSTTNRHEQPEWGACDAGELRGLGRKLRADASRRRLAGTGLAGAAVVALAAFIATTVTPEPADISCSVCKSRFEAYHAYLVARQAAEPGQSAPEADAKLVQVQKHLETCELCRGAFERAFPDVANQLAAIGTVAALVLLGALISRPKEPRSRSCPSGP